MQSSLKQTADLLRESVTRPTFVFFVFSKIAPLRSMDRSATTVKLWAARWLLRLRLRLPFPVLAIQPLVRPVLAVVILLPVVTPSTPQGTQTQNYQVPKTPYTPNPQPLNRSTQNPEPLDPGTSEALNLQTRHPNPNPQTHNAITWGYIRAH